MDVIINQKFNKLTIVSVKEKDSRRRVLVNCVCDCGNTVIRQYSAIIAGKAKSCGCIRKNPRTHGLSKHPLSGIWRNMLRRCFNEDSKDYCKYGGRGITVSEEWCNIENFINDMDNRPTINHTLDRIDNNGNYCKNNCKWSTKSEQSNNTSVNVLLTYNSETLTVQQWCIKTGLQHSLILSRINAGWSAEEVLTSPLGSRNVSNRKVKKSIEWID